MNLPSAQSASHLAGLQEAYFRHAKELLHASESRDDAWRAVRNCLHKRGFDLRKIEQFIIGYFPAADAIWQRLLRDGFAADEVRASNLLADSRLPGRMIGPIRDREGRILSFWAKLPQHLERCLYLSTQWKEQTAVFGLDVAFPAVANGRHDLLLVEDILDAVYLHAHGMPGVAAIGNSPAEISATRWERLDELGIHRATLAIDSFHDSHEAAVAAIRTAAQARRGPAIYVLPPSTLHSAWFSGQAARTASLESFENSLAAHRIHGFHYLALSLVALHKADEPWTDAARRAVLADARKFYASAHQRNVPQLDAFFLPPLLDALGLGFDTGPMRHDAWLDDAPSSNGSHIGASKADIIEESLPVRELHPAPIKSGDEVDSSRKVRSHGTDEFCDFHQCQRIVCLCWD